LFSSFVNFFPECFDAFLAIVFNVFTCFLGALSDLDFNIVAEDGFFDLILFVAIVAFSGFELFGSSSPDFLWPFPCFLLSVNPKMHTRAKRPNSKSFCPILIFRFFAL